MKRVGTLEAKIHFSALLEQVERGEEIVITRHGKAVARLVPVGVVGRDRLAAPSRVSRLSGAGVGSAICRPRR